MCPSLKLEQQMWKENGGETAIVHLRMAAPKKIYFVSCIETDNRLHTGKELKIKHEIKQRSAEK